LLLPSDWHSLCKEEKPTMTEIISPFNLAAEMVSPGALLVKLSGDSRDQSEPLNASVGVVREALHQSTQTRLLSFESAGLTATARISAGREMSSFVTTDSQKACGDCCGWLRLFRKGRMRARSPPVLEFCREWVNAPPVYGTERKKC
jgi:hypothetical protein